MDASYSSSPYGRGWSVMEGLIQRNSLNAKSAGATAVDQLQLRDGPKHLPRPMLHVTNKALWERFLEAPDMLEMLVNRSGRQLFPYPEFRLTNLMEPATYRFTMEVRPVEEKPEIYRFIDGKWRAIHPQNYEVNLPPSTKFVHLNSAGSTGRDWMQSLVSFRRAKICNATNKSGDTDGPLCITPGLKYGLFFELVQITDKQGNHLQQPTIYTFHFSEMNFIAVTQYHSKSVRYLKVILNPYAKAFRYASNLFEPDDTVERRCYQCKRKRDNTQREGKGDAEGSSQKQARFAEAVCDRYSLPSVSCTYSLKSHEGKPRLQLRSHEANHQTQTTTLSSGAAEEHSVMTGKLLRRSYSDEQNDGIRETIASERYSERSLTPPLASKVIKAEVPETKPALATPQAYSPPYSAVTNAADITVHMSTEMLYTQSVSPSPILTLSSSPFASQPNGSRSVYPHLSSTYSISPDSYSSGLIGRNGVQFGTETSSLFTGVRPLAATHQLLQLEEDEAFRNYFYSIMETLEEFSSPSLSLMEEVQESRLCPLSCGACFGFGCFEKQSPSYLIQPPQT